MVEIKNILQIKKKFYYCCKTVDLNVISNEMKLFPFLRNELKRQRRSFVYLQSRSLNERDLN